MLRNPSPRGRQVRAAVAWLLIAAMLTTLAGCSGGGGPRPSPIGAGGFGPAKWIIQQLAAGALGYIGGDSAGWLLSYVGGDDDSDDIKDAVDDMNTKLDAVISALTTIEGELDKILDLIQLTADDIKNLEWQNHIDHPQNIINNNYDNMQDVFVSGVIGTPAAKTNADDTMTDILDANGTVNIDQMMYDLNAGIMGLTPGVDSGAMGAFTTLLADHTGDGRLLDRYMALESYFEQLVVVQTKGLSMMMEALHKRDIQQTAGVAYPTDYHGTAQQWLDNKFTPWIEGQVEMFLQCTDLLVVAECDLRTEAVVGVPLLPDDANEIFKRADFIAAQLSSRHKFGVVVRAIGEPDTIKSIVANYHIDCASVPDSVDHWLPVVKLGVDPQDFRETPTHKGETYMEWKWGTRDDHSGFIKFDAVNTVAMAKFCQSWLPVHTNFLVETDFPHDTAQTSLSTAYYDDNMELVSAAAAPADSDDKHVYGHATLVIRHRPNAWYNAGTGAAHDHRLQPTVDRALDRVNPWCRARVTLLEHIGWTNTSAAFALYSAIGFPIINGTDSGQDLTAVVGMSSHYYNSVDLTEDNNYLSASVGIYAGESETWDPVAGNPHDYHHKSVQTHLDAGGGGQFVIEAVVDGKCKGDEGDDVGLRIWTRYVWLSL